MKINQLKLSHFRNYRDLDISFDDGLTIITGENAQGKTNLLEAIFLLAMGKSHRTHRDQELIQWGEDYASIEGIVSQRYYELPLSLYIDSKGKIARVNELEQAKLSSFVGNFNVVLFAPEDLQFVKGSPSIRRRFINAELGQAYPVYLQAILDYERMLKQRNTYLKQYGISDQFDTLYFQIMTEQFIDKAIEVIRYRIEFIKALNEFISPIHSNLSRERDSLRLEYLSSSSRLNYSELDELAVQLSDLLEQSQEREQRQGYSLYGPHRDDIRLWLNERDAQQFASQGQQRTIVLSIKLAELEWFKQHKGEYPVLLLDDVLSELDIYRQTILMEQIENKVQTFLTTATMHDLTTDPLEQVTLLYVHNGQINTQRRS